MDASRSRRRRDPARRAWYARYRQWRFARHYGFLPGTANPQPLAAELDAAAREMVILDRVVEPDRRHALMYEELFVRHVRLCVDLVDGRVVAAIE